MTDVRLFWILASVCVFAAAAPGSGAAQDTAGVAAEGGVETAKYRWGPVGVTPRISVTNVGIDNNVFNAEGERVRDFTATVGPAADTWLRIGRAQLSLRSSLNWTYFQKSADQRSLGFAEDARFDLLLNRVSPYVGGSYVSTRQRPNLEIDARVLQKQQRVSVGNILRLGPRTSIDLEVAQARVDFGDERFGDPGLADALNRERREANVRFRMALTPLTTFLLQTTAVQDRFRTAVQRDSNSVSVLPGFELKPFALISGRATVGYRLFDARDPLVPDFRGLVASADVRYVMREMTQFGLTVNRDLDYSAEDGEAYSVVTGGMLSISQAIGVNWYVSARAGLTELAYRGLQGTPTDPGATPGRTDRTTVYGGGIGRRIGTDLRIGFDVDQVDRRSAVAGRSYEGLRFGGSVIYAN